MLTKLRNQLRFMLRRNKSEHDLDREIRFHLEMEAQDMENEGASNDARRVALANFGSVAACKEAVRETWGLRIWSDLRRDFQYTLRMIRRKPGFAIIVVLTLSLGIGANTAVFSVFDRTVLRPLPYAHPEQLVHLWETRSNQEFAQMEASYPNFQDWTARNRSFAGLAGYNGTNFTLTGFGVPVRISAERVTTNMLSVLGVRPQLGRDFLPNEEALDNSHVALVTHGFWQTQLGGCSDVLGQSLRLNGTPHTIIGVLPADFRFDLGGATSLFVPLGPTPDQVQRRQFHWVKTIGRLKPGVQLEDAEAEIKSIAAGLAAEYSATNAGTSARLLPLQEQIVGNVKPVLLVVFGAAACMLCLALVNLANLIVAQSAVRQREMAIRAAIGAGTSRLGRQMIAESGVLALFAGILSLLVARWTLASIFAAIPASLLGVFVDTGTNIDGRVILFNVMLTVAAGMLAGCLGAFRVSRSSLNAVVKGGQLSHTNTRLRSLFTVAEVALSVLLLVGAVVMVESVQRLTRVDPGFKADHLVSMRLSVPAAAYAEAADIIAFYRELQRRTAAIPGVDKAAVVDELPLTTDGGTIHVYVQGQPQPAPGSEQESVIRSASPDYFETMGIALLNGRTFAWPDESSAKRIVVINNTLAKKLFPAQNPVGQRVVMPFDNTIWEVAGVVSDVHLANLDRAIRPTLYTCSLQDPSRSSNLVVRTSTDMNAIVAAVRREVQQMDPELPVYAARTMDQTINLTPGVATRKLVLYLVGAFSSIGILMAGVGLYGLLTFSVAQRSKEIGIRVALGAGRHSVKRLIFRQALMMTATGLVIGLIVAVLGDRLMQSIVFGVSPSSPGVLLIVSVLVAIVTYAACYVPIARATRIDPIIVLRHD